MNELKLMMINCYSKKHNKEKQIKTLIQKASSDVVINERMNVIEIYSLYFTLLYFTLLYFTCSYDDDAVRCC